MPNKRLKSQEKNIFQLCLPKGLSREELGTRSVRRNPLIADLLHRIALIEKAGTGIRRMIEDARKHKCPEPKFTVNGFFTTTF
jgi:ATP-dependent DNA helicase RecG